MARDSLFDLHAKQLEQTFSAQSDFISRRDTNFIYAARVETFETLFFQIAESPRGAIVAAWLEIKARLIESLENPVEHLSDLSVNKEKKKKDVEINVDSEFYNRVI